jgi:hypothetical protein
MTELLAKVAGTAPGAGTTIVPTNLIVRASSAPPPG